MHKYVVGSEQCLLKDLLKKYKAMIYKNCITVQKFMSASDQSYSAGRQQPQTYKRTMSAGHLDCSMQRPDLNIIVSLGLCEESEDNEKLWQSFPNCLG